MAEELPQRSQNQWGRENNQRRKRRKGANSIKSLKTGQKMKEKR
jgi:hypothetical protein